MGMLRRLILPALVVGALTAEVPGADDAPRDTPPSAVHLVGHEDAALLQRVQAVLDDWDPRKLRNPYVGSVPGVDDQGKAVTRKLLRRADLAEFIADVEAAEALGKAFFWEMQPGSDFRREGGKFVGTACASCHFRFGADPRNGYTTRIPYVAWDRYKLDPAHPLEFNETQKPFVVENKATEVIATMADLYLPTPRRLPDSPLDVELDAEDDKGGADPDAPRTPLSLIVGSQGVAPLVFKQLTRGNRPPAGNGDWPSEVSERRQVDAFAHYKPDWSMFIAGQKDSGPAFRQITTRNAPTVINSGFADRLFHDGRAESTFNGISIFGDFDQREVLHVRRQDGKLVPVRIAISKAALASQALGPIVNEVEMSYLGRSFPNLAAKLLEAPVLGHQEVDDSDSLLGRFKANGLVGPTSTYRALIQRAFRREWWDGSVPEPGKGEQVVDLGLAVVPQGAPPSKGPLMEANFSLYWGLSLLLYQAELVSNDSPFDLMMQGDGRAVNQLWADRKKTLEPIYLDRVRTTHPAKAGPSQPALGAGSEVFQRGFRIFLDRGCVECHSGPLFSELYARDDAADPKLPIGYTVERVLLPNSQGDAIDIRQRQQYDQVVEEIVRALIQADPRRASSARRVVQELELLRDGARGVESHLDRLVADRLRRAGFTNAPVEQIARKWIAFEKTAATFSGNRPFFTEDERVASAQLLTAPVLVEKMLIPRKQVAQRRPLPIRGPLAGQHYAFYDVAFYTLGITPPRYDRGVGNWSDAIPEEDPDQILDAMVGEVHTAPSGVYRQIREKLPRGIDLAKPEGRAFLREKIRTESFPELGNLNAAERRALSHQDQGRASPRPFNSRRNPIQAASGVSGSAYRFNPLWKRRPTRAVRDRQPEAAAVREQAAAPGDPVLGPSHDLDAVARNLNPRDISWFRDLPTWDRDFPPANPPFDNLDARRSDAHFFSRARALVQNEMPWGHRKPFLHDDELAFWGSFKAPTLRNVELTPPYMHNGRLLTLYDVMDFYDRGGDLLGDRVINPDKHPAIVDLDLSEDDKIAIVFLLMSLTDDRVRKEMAPFDHPSLRVVNGYDRNAKQRMIDLESVGSRGIADGLTRPTFPAGK